jgi:hypothetical protein
MNRIEREIGMEQGKGLSYPKFSHYVIHQYRGIVIQCRVINISSFVMQYNDGTDLLSLTLDL